MKSSRDLEDLARSVRRRTKTLKAEVTSQIDAEVSLLSERLDQLRRSQDCHHRGLLREECRIDTDLMSLKSYNPLIYAHSEKTRERLKSRRQQIKKEMRSLDQSVQQGLFAIHDRLFELLQQRAWLERDPG